MIEPSAGADRATLAFLVDAYDEEEVEGRERVVVRLHPRLAPVKVAVLPLVNKEGQLSARPDRVRGAAAAHAGGVRHGRIDPGERYRPWDEIGTPWGVTINHQTMDDDTVTLRDATRRAGPDRDLALGDELERELAAPWRTPKPG